jgi:anion-transporting  ArsA/GET3 family ATPase
MNKSLPALLNSSKVIVTAGTGGVGKTTLAAAIGMSQALQGRRCVVVTIDPAKRLAEALGMRQLTNDPTVVTVPNAPAGGQLWAAMLDTKATFDAVIMREASSERGKQILANRFYANISGSLSGTQEYMAAEKVFELVNNERFDVVVIDTPPAANALDFVTAPRRLIRFLDHSLFRVIIAPGRGALRLVSAAAHTVLKPITNVIGGAVVADAIEFFQLFEGLEDGFRKRAAEALQTLTSTSTSWVLVTTSDEQPVEDALTFAAQIEQAGISLKGVIMNRTEPLFAGLPDPMPAPSRKTLRSSGQDAVSDALRQVLSEHREACEHDGAAMRRLQAALGDIATLRVPRLPSEVGDAAALLSIAGSFVLPE